MTIEIILDEEHPSYDKAAAGHIGTPVSISIANDLSAGYVSGLEAGDNIEFEESHLLRNWKDGIENYLTVQKGLRTINITDYFGGETPYPAIKLNNAALPNELSVKILNDTVFATPYDCDDNFNDVITGLGYVTNLQDGDKISCASSPEYYFDSEGLGVQDSQNDIVIADNTTGGVTNTVYVAGVLDDISEKTLTVTERTLFNGSALGYKTMT